MQTNALFVCYLYGMKLIYIYHSGYVIEGDGFAILIDYYKDSGTTPGHGYVHEHLLQRPGRLYVLSSHFHPDHFNPEVLAWKEQKADIRYIFSKDILKRRRAKADDGLWLRKGDEYADEHIRIRAFGSTDVGISFLIEAGGKRIFHAGDLNNWHWKDESTLQEAAAAEKAWLHELEDVARAALALDVAMFPVDSHMGSDFARGAEQFVDRIRVTLFAPMHFGERYDSLPAFGAYAEARGVVYADWTDKGQSREF